MASGPASGPVPAVVVGDPFAYCERAVSRGLMKEMIDQSKPCGSLPKSCPLLERAPSGPAHKSNPREFDHPLREKGVEGGETGLFST